MHEMRSVTQMMEYHISFHIPGLICYDKQITSLFIALDLE